MSKKQEEEYRLIYNDLSNNIQFSKKQQWNTIYLTILSFVAIISLFSLEFENIKRYLVLASIIIFVFGIYFIGHYQLTKAEYRILKDKIVDKFSDETKKVIKFEFIRVTIFCKFFEGDFFPRSRGFAIRAHAAEARTTWLCQIGYLCKH